MTAKEFFDLQLVTDANSVIDKYAHKFSKFDLMRFAEAYLNEVIKDELKNFAKFINGNTTSHLFDEITKADINSYLNQEP